MAKKKFQFRVPIGAPLAVVGTILVAWASATRPLTGTLGPESAQILATTLGPLLFLAGAERASKRSERGFLGDLWGTLLLALVCCVIFLIFIGIADLSHESCAPGRGFSPYIVLALPVLLLHASLGTWIGRIVGRPKLAVLASVLVLIAYAFFEVFSWTLAPSLRVVTHLSVLIENDLFRGARFTEAQAFFRLATFLFAASFVMVGLARFPKRKRGAGFSGAAPGGGAYYAVAGALFIAALVTDSYSEDKLAPAKEDLDEAYSLVLERGVLHLHTDPAAFTPRESSALLAEAHLWQKRIENRLGIKTEKPVHIYLHRDARTKRKWTGASNVDFALPGPRELHIADARVPHPTLGHEIAHILTGDLSDGVLGVPATWGILPKPGLVEGLAMALTDELTLQGELTLRERAAAMRRAKLAPDIYKLMTNSLSVFEFFFENNMSNSYAAAGALVNDVLAQKGPEAVAKAYKEGEFEAAFSDEADPTQAASNFIEAHIAALDAMELPPHAVYYVQQHYSARSILNETCDPERRETARKIRFAAQRGAFGDAEALAFEADEELTALTLGELAQAATALEQEERAIDYYTKRADLRDTDNYRALASRLSDAGDVLWKADRPREAAARWQRVRADKIPPGDSRLVQVKWLLAEQSLTRAKGSLVADAAMDYLLSATSREDAIPSLLRLVETLAKESDAVSPAHAVARYLLMRNRLQRGDTEKGLSMALELFGDRESLPQFLHTELLRGIAIAHARRGDFAIAEAGFAQIAENADRAALRVMMRDRAERVSLMPASKSLPLTDLRTGDRWLLGIDSQISF